MPRLILLNKPYGVLCQFTAPEGRLCLKDFVKVAGVYPAGRLDLDSEGLVVLTDDGGLQARISDPRHKMVKVYWAQVEGEPDAAALAALRRGVDLGDFHTRACKAQAMPEPGWLWPRTPPIRVRVKLTTSWLRIELSEGKNRQVRRMTAAIGHPTLRLVREAVGAWSIARLASGSWCDAESGLIGT
jgi:23S rRNA pseudouridine2457 synthase